MINIWERQSVQGDLQPVMRKAQGRIASIYNYKGHPLMISSRRDGEHKPGSLHYDGLAEDYKDWDKHVSISEIKDAVGPGFDVIEYEWGYHVEYDPKPA